MADFLAEFARNDQTTQDWWSLYIDNVSNVKGSGAGIILEGPDNVTLEQALKLNFKATNNQAEYKAFIVGLNLQCYTDSQIIQGQQIPDQGSSATQVLPNCQNNH